jgi:2-polyprenyl-3-methyl-5-hydroxy-6-metoxy-1,4-benzoquinol methylase
MLVRTSPHARKHRHAHTGDATEASLNVRPAHPAFVERTACPACAATSTTVLYRCAYDAPPISDYLVAFYDPQGHADPAAVAGAEYRLDRCDACSLVFQRFAPGSELLESVYEQWIDPAFVFEAEHRSHDLGYFHRLSREIELIIRAKGVAPEQLRMLDVGMGWAEWCSMALAYGCVVSGTELSEARRLYAQKRGVEVLAPDEAGARKFDVINSEQVFEHLVEPLAVLRQLTRSLAPGGLLKISVPNGWDIERRLAVGDWTAPKDTANSLNPVAPLEHLNCFDHESLVTMAALAGLEPVNVLGRAARRAHPLEATLGDVARPTLRAVRRVASRGAQRSTYLFFQLV